MTVLNEQICENHDMNCTATKCQRREAQNCESFLKKKVPDLKVSASGIESQRCTPSRMHLVKFLKKVNFLSICIIMALCFLLLLNPFVFGAVTLFHVQLLVSFAIILTSAVVSIFTGLPNPVGISVSFRGFLLGSLWANPVEVFV